MKYAVFGTTNVSAFDIELTKRLYINVALIKYVFVHKMFHKYFKFLCHIEMFCPCILLYFDHFSNAMTVIQLRTIWVPIRET